MAKFRVLDEEENTGYPSDVPPVPEDPRFRTVPDEGLSFQDIHGDMPWYEKMLVAGGRGVKDLTQGVYQNYLMATDPEEAQRYTQQVNEELKGYQMLADDSPWLAGAGRVIGAAAPLAAAAPAGALGAAGLGALEGFSMFTPEAEWENKAINAGLGGVFAGGTQAAVNSLWRLPKASGPRAPEAVRTAAEEGIGLRPQDVSTNPLVQLTGAIGDSGILARSAEAPGARAAAERLVGQTQGGGSLLTSARRNLEDMGARQDELYGQLRQTMGQNNVRINPKLIRSKAQDLIQEQISSGLPNPTIVRRLEEIRDAVPEGNTFESWRKFRTQLADQMVNWNKEGISTAPLRQMYGQVTENLKAAAAASGDDALKLFEDANALTKQMMDLKATPAGKLIANGQDTKLANILKGGGDVKDSREAALALYNVLDDQGRESARNVLLQNAFDNSMDLKGNFKPSDFSKNLAKIRERTDVFFQDSPELIDQIRKIENVMAHAKDPTKAGILAKFFIPGSIAGVGSGIGASFAGAEGAAVGGQLGLVASQTLLPYMTRSRSVNALVDALNRTDPDTDLSRSLMAELIRIVQAAPAYGAATLQTQPEPMKIEIRNGVPQQ